MSDQAQDGLSYKNILVATDFSEASRSALRAGIWLATRLGAKLTLAHTLPDVRNLIESASYKGRLDYLYGEGSEFYQEVSQKSQRALREMIHQSNCTHQKIDALTLLGSPYVEITRAVQQYGFDLVIAGSRGLGDFQRLLLGSTAMRLIRKCPCSVWIVTGDQQTQPRSVLAATDFSETSQKAVEEGLRIARLADAEFHLLHTIDSMDVPEDILSLASGTKGETLRDAVNRESKRRFDDYVQSLHLDMKRCHAHLSFGNAWQEIDRLATRVNADLVAVGTTGRSGIKGVWLGNTAERVLNTCRVSVLAVKPSGFVSPILPPFAPLVPTQASEVSEE